jgi:hypothetical protein
VHDHDRDHRQAVARAPILAVAASLALGVVAETIFGGVAWIGALLLLGAAVGWSLLEPMLVRDGTPLVHAFAELATGRRRRLIPVALIAAAVVAAGVIVIGTLAGYL